MKSKLTFEEVKRVRCLAKEGYSTTFLTRLVISSREVGLYKDLRAQVEELIT